MSIGGVSVATSADLTKVFNEMQGKFDEHKKWTESCISDHLSKLRTASDRLDAFERDQHTDIEGLKGELKSLRNGTVTNAAFRQQVALADKRFDHEKEEAESRREQLRFSMEKDITHGVGHLRSQTESLNANCLELKEKFRVMQETVLPTVKGDLDEQKAKRLCETQRLEAELEKMKDICEQKIAQTAGALRFYVNATTTKLKEEVAPLELAKSLEEDLKQRTAELQRRFKASEETMSTVKDELAKHRGAVDANHERLTGELGKHSKDLKVQAITVTNLQNSMSADVNSINETLKHDKASIQNEVAEARAGSQRQIVAQDAAIQAVAGEIGALRQFRELMVDRLRVESAVAEFRELQGTHVPQTTAAVKELEEKSRRLSANVSKDHDSLCELQKATSAIRSHFKMFHAIAAGLDDAPFLRTPEPRLPAEPPGMASTTASTTTSTRAAGLDDAPFLKAPEPPDQKLPPIDAGATPRR